jgi:excisionase family DNA binding protein
MMESGAGQAGASESYLTIKEAATFLRVSPVTVARLLRDRKLKRFKVGGRTLIRQRDAEALVREA